MDEPTCSTDKIDQAVLALLHLTSFSEGYGVWRAWKSHDWDALDRLYEQGLISNPKSKAKSVVLTDKGHALAQELFQTLFGQDKPTEQEDGS